MKPFQVLVYISKSPPFYCCSLAHSLLLPKSSYPDGGYRNHMAVFTVINSCYYLQALKMYTQEQILNYLITLTSLQQYLLRSQDFIIMTLYFSQDVLELSLIQSTGGVNLNLTCHHTLESVSNFTTPYITVQYCLSGHLKVGEGSQKFAQDTSYILYIVIVIDRVVSLHKRRSYIQRCDLI